MEWMLMPLKRYADFEGRSRRKEFWMFQLGVFLFFLVLEVAGFGMIGTSPDSFSPLGGLVFGVLGLAILALFVPAIAVQVRRLHDQDKTGWMIFLGFIPVVGGIILLVLCCLEGTRGPNRFGPDPVDPAGSSAAGF